ncbi:hypothetical protein NB16F96_14780 [Escherichia coli]
MVAPVRLMTLAYLHVICALIVADKGAAPLVFRHRSFYSSYNAHPGFENSRDKTRVRQTGKFPGTGSGRERTLIAPPPRPPQIRLLPLLKLLMPKVATLLALDRLVYYTPTHEQTHRT